MRLRAFSSSLALLVFTSVLTGLTTTSAQALVADRDCGDFASQRAAQIFYLKQGGPQRDPHGLDADDDGVACDSNPCPCYGKKRLPGAGPGKPATVDSTVRLTADRLRAIQGETVRLRAAVDPDVVRTVVLQRRSGGSWERVAGKDTNRGGVAVFARRAGGGDTSYRAVIKAFTRDERRYAGDTSGMVVVQTLRQSGILRLPATADIDERLTGRAIFTPARPGRDVLLQRRNGTVWTVVANTEQDADGEARFRFRATVDGTQRYRAVALRHRGAVAAVSNIETVEVAAPDTTAPPKVTGVTATPGDEQVQLSWTASTAEDLAGYGVYRRVQGTTQWTLVNQVVVTTPTYTVTGLTNGVTYEFAVNALDESGNDSVLSNPVAATPVEPDTTAPAVPANVVATPGDGSIAVSWDAVTDADLAGYRVYYRTSPDGTWTLASPALVTGTSFNVTGLTNGTAYDVTVASVDDADNESVKATPATATPTAGP